MARQKQSAAAVEGPSVPMSLLEKYKDFPGIEAITRRIDNPEHEPGSVDVRLVGEPDYVTDPHGRKRIWKTRWINGGQEGRFSMVTDVKGYVPVRLSELRNPDQITGRHTIAEDGPDPIVRRGDKGIEVLVKMPLELYSFVKAKQEEARKRRARNAKAVKEDLANAAGAQLGSEAGDMIHDEFSLSVKQQRRTSLAEELGDDQA